MTWFIFDSMAHSAKLSTDGNSMIAVCGKTWSPSDCFYELSPSMLQSNLCRECTPPVKAKTANEVFTKLDSGKPRIDLVPPEAIIAMAEVFTLGSAKYGDDNWKLGSGPKEQRRLYAALQRHLLQWAMGNVQDESGLTNLAHAACNLSMLLKFEADALRATKETP